MAGKGTHIYMNELEDTKVEVVEKYTHDGINTFTLMKHKHQGHTHEWRHYDYNVVLRWLLSAPIYKMHEGVGGCEAPPTQSFRLQTSQGTRCFSYKETVYSSKSLVWALSFDLLKKDALQTRSSHKKKMVKRCHIKHWLFSHIYNIHES